MKKAIKVIAIVAVVAVLCAVLVACIPSDYKKAETNLKNAGYTVTASGKDDTGFSFVAAAFTAMGADGLTAIVEARKGNEEISILYFDSNSHAKDFYNKIKDDAEDEEIKCSGKIVYSGTKQAIKDAK